MVQMTKLYSLQNKHLSPVPMSDGLSKFDQSNIKFIPYNDKKILQILNKTKKIFVVSLLNRYKLDARS